MTCAYDYILCSLNIYINISDTYWVVVTTMTWQLRLHLVIQSVPITTNVENSCTIDGEVNSIQFYVIKDGCFLCVHEFRVGNDLTLYALHVFVNSMTHANIINGLRASYF